MKQEWKKHEKELYGVKKSPQVIEVPLQNYITISGTGNPNGAEFSEKVAALFSLAYKIKMQYKMFAMRTNCEISDYTVYPLEGIWSKQKDRSELIKEELQYTIMIRQPDFITTEMFNTALELTKKKKTNPFISNISFEEINDGKCVQILHIGSFDDEPATFEKLEHFCKQNNIQRINNSHREIYLNNANRVSVDKLQTILRYKVK